MVMAKGHAPGRRNEGKKRMNFKFSAILAGFALAVSSAPAGAADFDDYNGGGYKGGSVKDGGSSSGIAVPAPAPIPVLKADYYIRGDVGVGFGETMSASEQGLIYGYDNNGAPVELPDAWVHNDGDLPMTFGIGVGRYWSDHFRTDVTIDWMRQYNALVDGSLAYIDTNGNVVGVSTFDKTKREGGIFLANAYIDFGSGEKRRFTPYIGAGLGFALNILDRWHETTIDSCATCTEVTGSMKSTTVALAAAAMLGFTYDFGGSVLLDVNYRFLHVGGADAGLDLFGSSSKLSIDDMNDHQLRAGVRVNID
jgi:opacity protein-like surface antigen